MNCDECKGTGIDAEKTRKARARHQLDAKAYIRCWACLGNGLKPATRDSLARPLTEKEPKT